MSERDDQIMLRSAALNAQAITQIVAELGPRALPTLRENYMASATAIADNVFGHDWDYRLTLDATGAPHIFVEQYRGV